MTVEQQPAPSSGRPTTAAIRRLHAIAMSIAVHYVSVDEYPIGGLVGQPLRDYIVHAYSTGKLKGAYQNHCYMQWINPVANKFLVEGGFRKQPKRKEFLSFTTLTTAEVQYLTVRFQQIALQFTQRYARQSAIEPTYSTGQFSQN